RVEATPDPFRDCRDDRVAETGNSTSVHPRGNPISHSTNSGWSDAAVGEGLSVGPGCALSEALEEFVVLTDKAGTFPCAWNGLLPLSQARPSSSVSPPLSTESLTR